jgi:hypothetical protein
MPAGVTEIDAAAAVIMIDGHVFGVEGAAAIFDILPFQAREYLVEFRFGYLERVMVRLEFCPLVEIQG